MTSKARSTWCFSNTVSLKAPATVAPALSMNTEVTPGCSRSWHKAAASSANRSQALRRSSVPVRLAMTDSVCVTSNTWQKLW
eukprot:CAMPEP_0180119158 /NCGR_PEP_ID=MMETSP0986-20121125/1840_1 /TAXON_ID=697907 /ORGANISM="non described non described, Strain CCMP2293" /LENGTH=81 /DNA_ID=CAMNT_0022058155 /DNA_START=20 /DNA_END=265 /DNA_ORIENTATION=-